MATQIRKEQMKMSTARLLGRTTASTGTVEEISIGSSLSLSSGSLAATAGGSTTQLQYNSAGSFAGISGVTSNGTSITATLNNVVVANLLASSNDSGALGASGTAFSDIFLASGAVIDFAAGNATLTHSTGLLTSNVPLSLGTTNALTAGTIELGHASDTTISRVSAGVVAVEGKNVALNGTGETLTTGTIELGAASDTTLSRSSAGVLAVEGVVVDTISAANTLTNKTLTSPTIQTAPVFASGTTSILTVPTVDDTATGEITNAFNSGYSSTAIGDLVYLDSSGTWQKADADLSAAAYSGILGIALEVKASGNAVKVLLRGFAYCSTAFPTFTVGGIVYMSATAGAVTQTAPTTTDSATRILGYAVHADKMWFNPSNDWITHS